MRGSHCSNKGVLICDFEDVIRQWVSMDIFLVLFQMHCTLILALLAIARLAQVDLEGTEREWFLSEYELSNIKCMPSTPGVTCKCAYGTEATKCGYDKILLICQEELAELSTSRDFDEQVWHRFLEKGGDSVEYAMSDEQHRVTGYQSSPVTCKGTQENLTHDVDLNSDTLREAVDDDEHWDLDGSRGEESAQRVGVKRRLQDWQDKCQTKRWKALINITEADELAQKLLRSSDASTDTEPPLEAPSTTRVNVFKLSAELAE